MNEYVYLKVFMFSLSFFYFFRSRPNKSIIHKEKSISGPGCFIFAIIKIIYYSDTYITIITEVAGAEVASVTLTMDLDRECGDRSGSNFQN